jgi:Icc-related predicted phosphoesterase
MGYTRCFLVSDLHGRIDRYKKLFAAIRSERPQVVFMVGDLLPHRWSTNIDSPDFTSDIILRSIRNMREVLGEQAPRMLLILGNDDERAAESGFITGNRDGFWEYLHQREARVGIHRVVGYSCVPPTPFLLKDWERYDVGRYLDPGCVSPEEGYRTADIDAEDIRTRTIAADLKLLVPAGDTENTVVLTHSPPYQTNLDRAALDGRSVDHAPLDVHVGSIAIRRLVEDRQPLLSLHGHIHESARITGSWRDRIGRTHCFTGAHDGPELALVRFDLEDLEAATRELI